MQKCQVTRLLSCEIVDCLEDRVAVLTTRCESQTARTGLHDIHVCEAHLSRVLSKLDNGGLYHNDVDVFRVWWRRL